MSEVTGKFEVKQTEDSQGDAIFTVFLNGESVFIWDDSANVDYPEDLSWSRLISDCFYSGVDAGMKAQAAEIESLKRLLNQACCYSHGSVISSNCKWCQAVNKALKGDT